VKRGRRSRSAAQTAARARALAALVLRANGEQAPDEDWSPEEQQLLARRSEQDVLDATWRAEGLAMLVWALGLQDELPAWDEPVDPLELARTLDLNGAELRDDEELADALEAARLWHWRARTTLLEQDPDVELPERWDSFDQLIAATAMKGYEDGYLPQPRRGDFPALGKAYRHLSHDEHALTLSIAGERHFALAWVNGLSDEWDATPTDT
jgi:hypothetical protein